MYYYYSILLCGSRLGQLGKQWQQHLWAGCLLKIASLNKFELCWCCHKTSWQPLLFDGYLLTLQEHFLTTTISFPNENRIHSYYVALKSDNLQYITLVCLDDGPNELLTKRLMFQVLFFFILSCKIFAKILLIYYYYFFLNYKNRNKEFWLL